MYWTFEYNGKRYASWGAPRIEPYRTFATSIKERYDIKVYNGEQIQPNESACWLMQSSNDLGLGDSIWLINYLRDVYRIKGRRRCNFKIVSGDWVHKFYSNFLPKSFEMVQEFITEDEFMAIEHKLPSMYYWHDTDDADRSWLDNRSIVQRLYAWSGIEYNGLADWGEFTNQEILYPKNEFWTDLGLNKKDKYVYFQWHSSGHAKNLPPQSNIKLIKHIIKQYGYKVYVVGRLKCLDSLNSIHGVVNLSGKTEGHAEALFTLAFNSEFIVSPDSAGVHLSEAYKIPSVCIMGTLPPSYIASKYKIPAFMYGSGACPYRPCGIVHHLPKATKCPPGTKDYCRVFDDVNLTLFDRCVQKSFDNRARYRSSPNENFYEALVPPISLHYQGILNQSPTLKKNQNQYCVVLTATIDPKNCIILKRSDPKIRENDYLIALEKWLKNTNLPIVFIENSMYDLSKLKELANQYPNRVEFLQFEGNQRSHDLGKGFEELNIMEYGLKNSKTISESENIIKVTGRIFIPQIKQILSSLPVDRFVNYCVNVNNNNFESIQLVMYICKKDFINQLSTYKELINDSKRQYIEKAFVKCVKELPPNYKTNVLSNVKFDGISGGDDTDYDVFINKLSRENVIE